MIKKLAVVLLTCLTATSITAFASPQSDLKAYQSYFKERFPGVAFQDFGNGIYALNKPLREQWENMEEFPPYEIAVDEGKDIFERKFKNGKTLGSCFENDGIGIAQNYPYFDEKRGMVITLPLAVNDCRKANGEKPYGWKKGKLAAVVAYMAYTSRGKPIDIKVESSAATAAYEKGKNFYYTRRGQLNLACAHCHVDYAGNKIRGNILSTGLGQTSHFPVYRSKWGGLGTLHRRFGGCNKQVRAKPFKAQSEEYRDLEYFLTYMSNGIDINAPGSRF